MPRFVDVTDKTVARSVLGVSIALIPLDNYLADGQSMPDDGVTDAAELIQTALDDLLDKANGAQPFGDICYVLELPAGRFRIDDTIRPGGTTPSVTTTNIGVKGAGIDQTFILPNGATSGFTFYPNNEDLELADPVAQNCHFSDFTIDMADATRGPGDASRKGFVGRGFVDCSWTHVRVKNSPATAFGVDYPVRCVFDRCIAETTNGGVATSLDLTNGPIDAAKYWSGFGFGFGVFDDESVLFIGCEATDCYRAGFFFEAFESADGFNDRTAVIQMIGCRTEGNRIGIANVGSGTLIASNCKIVGNSVCGYYGGVSGSAQDLASIGTTLDTCLIAGNGYGIYAVGDYTTVDFRLYSSLADVMGGYRITNCRIEDNTDDGIHAERFGTIEAGGLAVRGNQFRRNTGTAISLSHAVGPVRDLAITDNYFDGNDDTAISLMVAMHAPTITGNVFCNSDGGGTQTVGIAVHPAEPISHPLISGNTFRQIDAEIVNGDRLQLADPRRDRELNAAIDTDDPWLYREAFYGGENTTWPTGSDGWAKNTGGSAADWLRTSVGIAKGGSGTAISYIYRDLGTSASYVETRITRNVAGDDLNNIQFLGVMHSLASSSARTAVVAGVNRAGSGNAAVSDYYSLWRVVGGTWTLLWESSVPASEGHAVALARTDGSTVTDMFIDGVLVHSEDVAAVVSTDLAGVCGEIISGYTKYLGEFRASPYSEVPPPLVSGSYYLCNSPNGNSTSSSLTADRARTSAWIVETVTPLSALTAEFTAAGDAASVFRVCLWSDDGYGRPGELLLDAGTISTGSGDAGDVATGGTPGEYAIDVDLTLRPGLYHVGGIVQGVSSTQPTMRLIDYRQVPHTGPVGSDVAANKVGGGWYQDGFSGAAGDFTSPIKNTSQSTVAARIGYRV